MTRLSKILSYILFQISSSQLTAASQGPIVALDYGSFQGNLTGDSIKFLGIPFAAPPYVIPPVLVTNFSSPSKKVLEKSVLRHLQHQFRSRAFARRLPSERRVFNSQQGQAQRTWLPLGRRPENDKDTGNECAPTRLSPAWWGRDAMVMQGLSRSGDVTSRS